MRKILFLFAVISVIVIEGIKNVSACIGSECKPCPIGFSLTKKCCKDTNKSDCFILNDEIEDCGQGEWLEYPEHFVVAVKECCKDLTENNCLFINHSKEICGQGEFKEYPYSPIKKCCKRADEKDCVIIRAKRKCGEYQLEQYPMHESDCCNSFFKKCTRKVQDCDKCL